MYISEIAPLNLRGGLGTVNQLAVTIGLLLSQVLGVEQILGTNDGWPVLLGLAICPAILQLILLPICPESPRYLLITKQWEEEARRALRRLRASNAVEEDIEEMRAEERAQQSESHMTTMELICSPTLRAPLIIGIVMQLSQQLSGINAVFYYSTFLFTSAGLTEENAKFATIGIGAIMVSPVAVFKLLDLELNLVCFPRCCTGCNDFGVHTADGPNGTKNTSFIWIGRNVYIFYFHNDFIFDKGKLKMR